MVIWQDMVRIVQRMELRRARGTKTRSVLVFGVWGFAPNSAEGDPGVSGFTLKLRKIKTAERF
jgi:hypothetical protein